MKKTLVWLFIVAFTAFASGGARAQEDPTQQQIDQINGQIQTILATQGQLTKRIEALEKEIGDLRDKLNQPAPDVASADDLKKLTAQVQALAQKQQDDNDLVLKELEKLARGGGISAPGHKPQGGSETAPTASGSNAMTSASVPQKGYEYPIAKGDTIEAIARAYRAQGVKVTTEQILAANPGLNPKALIVGKKIFIPDPNAK